MPKKEKKILFCAPRTMLLFGSQEDPKEVVPDLISIEDPGIRVCMIPHIPISGVRGWIINARHRRTLIKMETQRAAFFSYRSAALDPKRAGPGILCLYEGSEERFSSSASCSFYLMDILDFAVEVFGDRICQETATGIYVFLDPKLGIRQWVVLNGVAQLARWHSEIENCEREIIQTWEYAERTFRPTSSPQLWIFGPRDCAYLAENLTSIFTKIQFESPSSDGENAVAHSLAAFIAEDNRTKAKMFFPDRAGRLSPRACWFLNGLSLVLIGLGAHSVQETIWQKESLLMQTKVMQKRTPPATLNSEGVLSALTSQLESEMAVSAFNFLREKLVHLKKSFHKQFYALSLSYKTDASREPGKLIVHFTPAPNMQDHAHIVGAYEQAKKTLLSEMLPLRLENEVAFFTDDRTGKMASQTLHPESFLHVAQWAWGTSSK